MALKKGLSVVAQREALHELLHTLPPVTYAAAYGSAVIKQAGYEGSGMVDYILAVDDETEWHRQNLERNGGAHYSFLRFLGPHALARIQSAGAGVYFNVPNLRGQCQQLSKAKYAVVERGRLCRELTEWDNLYLSGRLQKPVVTLVACPRVEEALQRNLAMACAAALLLLPQRFLEPRLYSTIAGISYTGDPRMHFAEHPDKAAQIAGSHTEGFRRLYASVLTRLPLFSMSEASGECQQDMSASTRARLLLSLPRSVVRRALSLSLATRTAFAASTSSSSSSSSRSTHAAQQLTDSDIEEVLTEAIRTRPSFLFETLPECLAGIIRPAARIQMVKGFLTFGVATSVEYIKHKIGRGMSARLEKKGEKGSDSSTSS